MKGRVIKKTKESWILIPHQIKAQQYLINIDEREKTQELFKVSNNSSSKKKKAAYLPQISLKCYLLRKLHLYNNIPEERYKWMENPIILDTAQRVCKKTNGRMYGRYLKKLLRVWECMEISTC